MDGGVKKDVYKRKAPHGLRGLNLDVWATENSVEIYHELERVAYHARSKTTHKFKTDPLHYPPAHRAYLEEDVQKSLAWAQSVGSATSALITDLLSGPYPLRQLRRSQTVLQLSRKYSKALLEQAAVVANRFNQTNAKYLERVIKQNATPLLAKGGEPIKRGDNPNLRGLDKILH